MNRKAVKTVKEYQVGEFINYCGVIYQVITVTDTDYHLKIPFQSGWYSPYPAGVYMRRSEITIKKQSRGIIRGS